MKSSTYAYAIATSHTDKTINVFKVKELERVIGYNNV
jgi:hypothetical protein